MSIFSISESILTYIPGFGILQGILLSLLVYFHPKADRSVNKFLALYIFFFSVVMTMPFILQAISWQNPYFIQPIPLLTGPFLYLYLRSFKEVITWRKALPHFLLFFSFLIPAVLLHKTAGIIPGYINLGQCVFYFFLSQITLTSYQRSIKQFFSETSKINMKWAALLVNGYLLSTITGILVFSAKTAFPQYSNLLLLANFIIAITSVYMAVCKGITRQRPRVEVYKVIKPELGSRKLEVMIEKIISLMEEDKLYQETELTLQALADRLKIPAHQVLQTINEGMNENFYDLVNSFRVEEAKRLLLHRKNRNYSILSVGFEAGFNSIITFNTVFKEFTGLMPMNFRQRQNNLSESRFHHTQTGIAMA